MSKVALIVFADDDGHENLGRVTNALEAAKEFDEAGDDVKLIFDGGGTQWIPTLADPEHDANPLFEQVEDVVTGACSFCAKAFHVKDEIEELGFPLIEEYDGHPSMKQLVDEGYQVITF